MYVCVCVCVYIYINWKSKGVLFCEFAYVTVGHLMVKVQSYAYVVWDSWYTQWHIEVNHGKCFHLGPVNKFVCYSQHKMLLFETADIILTLFVSKE